MEDRMTDHSPDHARNALDEALYEIKRVIVGQDAMLERLLVALLSSGHVLLEGVPGLAKTLTIKTLAQVLGGSFSRIQFTPDLVPSDIVGTRVLKPGGGGFDVELGPVFANFLLADEINRAPAKVQSALLEVMQERQVTIGGRTYPVPDPFLVLATQNPIESEGTYPLPEAQTDRFLMKLVVDYPDTGEEAGIVGRSLAGFPVPNERLALHELARYREAAEAVFVEREVIGYAVSLADAPDLAMARRASGVLPGERRAPGVGAGTELFHLRPYEPGDDVRQLDAAASARTGIPHVRLHVPERALTTWLVLDVSPSMAFGTARRLKADIAEGVALVFGRLGIRRAGSVGALVFGAGAPHVLPPRGSKPGMVALRRAV